jgi:integrase/recombinase XerD
MNIYSQTHKENNSSQGIHVYRQRGRLWAVARVCRWAVRVGYFENSPASALDLPRKPQPLPAAAFSIAEVEKIMALPNVETGAGLRDRALMELLYATGMRRAEACALMTADIERERGVVRIVAGKGNN